MARLIPCASCARHVRDTDAACPFCGAAAPVPAPLPTPPRGRMSRSALLAAGIAGSLAATDCSTSHSTPLYGAFAPPGYEGDDSFRDPAEPQVGAPSGDAGDDAEQPMPLYGGFFRPDDAGDDAANATADAGDAGTTDAEAGDADLRDGDAGAAPAPDGDVGSDR